VKILLTGATGFLGSELCDELLRRGHDLVVASRSLPDEWNPYPAKFIKWPLVKAELSEDLSSIEACIHLAGEPIAGRRWTTEQKDRIYDSRIGGTRQVVDLLREAPRLKTFLSSSAVGFYGHRGRDSVSEDSGRGSGFLADVCSDWENEASKLSQPTLRTVFLRTGVVLGRGSGFLGEMEKLFHARVGSPVGSGEQFLSWIHLQDWVNAVVQCLESESVAGPVNLVAPNPVSNRTFSLTMEKLFGLQLAPTAPAWALKLGLGEMSALALEGAYVVPKALEKSLFKFSFPDLEVALRDLFELGETHREVDDVFTTKQWVSADINQVFDFFADEKNLERITPSLLNFKVEKKSTVDIERGTLIDYTLKIHGIPVHWRTRIEEWVPGQRFTDNQINGPYTKWFHTHYFEKLRGGVLMRDRVLFRLPMGLLGRMGGLWLVRRDVGQIFAYRRKVIREIFKPR
jgi:uncharacterized protein